MKPQVVVLLPVAAFFLLGQYALHHRGGVAYAGGKNAIECLDYLSLQLKPYGKGYGQISMGDKKQAVLSGDENASVKAGISIFVTSSSGRNRQLSVSSKR